MDAKLKAKWVKALRSGEFNQRRGALYRKERPGFEAGYCCLGVLAKVKGRSIDDLLNADFLEDVGINRCLNQDTQICLAQLNDAYVPFEMIAGFIHENL